ncbi:MAG: tetracycline resistance MFS efflux pump [Myxococcales bacterium]
MSEAQRGGGRSPLLVVFLTVFMDLLGFGIIIPIQPFYAEAYGASPTVVTLLGGSYSLMQLLFIPMWGRLSDRIGRRPVILVSIAASITGYVAFALADSIPLLFLARMLTGFGNANIATAQAVIADTTTPAERAKGMGLIGAAFGLGFVLGPMIGGLFGQLGMATPIWVAAGLSAANWLFAWRSLPETLVPGNRVHAERRVPLPLKELAVAFRSRQTGTLLALLLAITVAFSLMEQVLGLFIEVHWVDGSVRAAGDRHSEAYREAAWLMTQLLIVIGLTSAAIQGGLVGRLVKRFGERSLTLPGLALMTASLALVPLVPSLGPFALMFPVSVGMAVAASLYNPSLMSLLSRTGGERGQGELLGLGQSMSALGRVLGPAAAGVLFEVGPAVPFWVSAAIMGGALLLAFGLRQPD